MTDDTLDDALTTIPTCALDQAGVRAQRERYARLAPMVTSVAREPEAVAIEFGEDFDRHALDQALAVERECCPFFRFELDESGRRLRLTVQEAGQLPALDVIARAFGAES